MNDIYGFGEAPAPVSIPVSKKKKKRTVDKSSVKAAADVGETQGFVDRTPSSSKKVKLKPGRKRVEEQDRVTITGPKRVIDELRLLSQNGNLPMWQILEAGLKNIQLDED